MALGTIGALVASSAIGAVGSLAAGNAQKQASKNQLQLQERMYDEGVARLQPYAQSGQNALAAYNYELGLGTQPEGYNGLSLSPSAQFAMTQGRDTIEGSGAVTGSLRSGATLEALDRFRMGLATQDRDNQLNRLVGLASSGQNAATGQAAAGQNFASMGSNALANYGNAQSAAITGTVNSLNNGITGFLQNQQHNRLLAG